MKFPLWKICLSYLTDVYIESSSSELNEELHVILSKGRLQLCSANAIYSFEDLYKNFALLFEQIDLSYLKENKVLILGFGLGSIPILLEKNSDKVIQYIGIEKDEEVIYLANKYILPKIKGSIQLISTDAMSFVQNCQEKFELILIDVFIDDVIPSELLTTNFLSKVNSIAAEDSMVIMNTLANEPANKAKSVHFFDNVFKQVFKEAKALTLHKNLMLLSNSQNLRNN